MKIVVLHDELHSVAIGRKDFFACNTLLVLEKCLVNSHTEIVEVQGMLGRLGYPAEV